MARLDRLAAEYRAQAMASPLTRANTTVFPKIELGGGIAIAISLNA